MDLTPLLPSAGPTGGLGLACPAPTMSLTIWSLAGFDIVMDVVVIEPVELLSSNLKISSPDQPGWPRRWTGTYRLQRPITGVLGQVLEQYSLPGQYSWKLLATVSSRLKNIVSYTDKYD
jgi:hypothetical protein